MKAIALSLILALISLGAQAQTFEVPQNYKFENAKDYDTYEKDIVNCVNWLITTPIHEQKFKRQEANAFLFKWVSGSPKAHVEIKETIVNFADNPDLLIIFVGGWVKNSIESGDYNNKIAGVTAGLTSVMDFYAKNKALMDKQKGIEKYIKMREKGTLKEYIEKNA
jgi:hypothetical protein